MVKASREWRSLWREHQILLDEYGRAQSRCSEALAQQAARIRDLEAQVDQLHARVMVGDTALAWAKEDHARLVAANPGLPRRFFLARHIDRLAERIQNLLRERNAAHWQQAPRVVKRGRDLGEGAGSSRVMATWAKSILCVGHDETAAAAARAAVETAGGRFLLHNGDDDSNHVALEDSLMVADLVICQTGCISHNAYWRVRDHCRRTGKECVLVAHPDALDAVKASKTPTTAQA